MRLWKLILAYDGSDFHGWQVQPRLPTIQGMLAAALRRVTGEDVLPQGSGRTDSGVHALGQVASFPLQAAIPPANLLRALNRVLPPAIRVLSANLAPEDFHARHSALRKTYEYRIFPRVPDPSVPHSSWLHRDEWAGATTPDRICPPTLARFVWDCPWPLDLDRASEAAAEILGTHDFTSFAASDLDLATRSKGGEKSPIRTVFSSTWNLESGLILYRVIGSGFLHHMVRNLVGTFVEAACGRIAPDAIPTILSARNRSAAGPTAPAQGLFLVNVDYPGAP